MTYTCTIEINLPINKTVALWDNPAYFNEWQDGFESFVHLKGTPNTKGAQSRIYLNGQHKMELLETILVANLPIEKTAIYEHIHMTNTQTTRFTQISPNKTSYTSQVTYTQFNGLMIKLMAKLFPGKFKAQSLKWMKQFKSFAEKHG